MKIVYENGDYVVLLSPEELGTIRYSMAEAVQRFEDAARRSKVLKLGHTRSRTKLAKDAARVANNLEESMKGCKYL